jgi:transcriptional regulator with XRE-family HTH domain
MTETKKQQIRERIGKRIAALRKLAGMTQEDLALRAGIQRTHLGRIENGKYAVTLETLQAIAEALYMTVDIIDTALADLAPLKKLTPPDKGAIGEAMADKVTDTFLPRED